MKDTLKAEHQIYADLMDEARLRLDAMQLAIDSRDQWVPRLLQEFCYLQLRMLCETIALGCLVIQDDITNKNAFKKYRPLEIMNQLDKTNPDFFPKGVRFRLDRDNIYLDDFPEQKITKSDLIALWEKSGQYLHRGTAKKLSMANNRILSVDLDLIISEGTKIKNLLEQHIISSSNKKTHLLVMLSSQEHGGSCGVWVAKN